LDPSSLELIEGRFYRAPEGTPFAPVGHWITSRDWERDKNDPAPLGEYSGPRGKDRGLPPNRLPELVIVGTKRCIERGGGGGEAVTGGDDFGSFLPLACYKPPSGAAGERIKKCPDKALFAAAMSKVWSGGWAAAAAAILGEGTDTHLYENDTNSIFSSYGIAKRGRECHIYIDGTRNLSQVLLQAYHLTAGPTNQGPFEAAEIYWQNANRILDRASLIGCGTCDRWVLIGHSYGGATAAVAAAMLRVANPLRDIAVMSEGAPRAGGRRLIEVLRSVDQRHYRRPLDPIPLLPPQSTSGLSGFDAVFLLIAFTQWAAWGGFYDYESTFVLLPDGSLGEENFNPPSSDLMSTIALQLWNNTAVASYAEHWLTAYERELALACGIAPPPGYQIRNRYQITVTGLVYTDGGANVTVTHTWECGPNEISTVWSGEGEPGLINLVPDDTSPESVTAATVYLYTYEIGGTDLRCHWEIPGTAWSREVYETTDNPIMDLGDVVSLTRLRIEPLD